MRIEVTPLGRIVIADRVPPGRAVFYTTIDDRGIVDHRIIDLLAARFGINATLAQCNQVHGTNVARAGKATTCDALYTTDRNVALIIKVADCLPVTLIDRDVIANIHSGWRGAAQRITAVTIDTLERETEFDPRSAYAYLGPSIRLCCFEVGEEVAAQFPASVIDRGFAKPHVDVVALTIALLKERGFAADRVVDSGLCTRCDDSIFHSYRREGKGGGRNLAIVA